MSYTCTENQPCNLFFTVLLMFLFYYSFDFFAFLVFCLFETNNHPVPPTKVYHISHSIFYTARGLSVVSSAFGTETYPPVGGRLLPPLLEFGLANLDCKM